MLEIKRTSQATMGRLPEAASTGPAETHREGDTQSKKG